MKTRSLSFFLCFFTLLYLTSCKKTDVTEPEKPVLSSKDPQAVSAAVKVWHGERLQGNAPAPRGSGLELDASASLPITYAFSGKFAIIDPQISQGDVEGYYLQFNGAKEYFKIDYSKPRGGRVRGDKKIPTAFSRDQRSQNGNADSSIVIALPDNLQVPDTFCVSYWAYDAQGNISNVVNTCIVVNSLGTDAAGNWLNGTWKNTAIWDSSFSFGDTIIFNKWYAARGSEYFCNYDSISGNYYVGYMNQGNPAIASDSIFHKKSHIIFGSNGGMTYEYEELYKQLNVSASTCSQSVYEAVNTYADQTKGAWHYNSTTGKMVLVFEYDFSGSPVLDAWEYHVVKLNNNHFLLVDDPVGYPLYIRFER